MFFICHFFPQLDFLFIEQNVRQLQVRILVNERIRAASPAPFESKLWKSLIQYEMSSCAFIRQTTLNRWMMCIGRTWWTTLCIRKLTNCRASIGIHHVVKVFTFWHQHAECQKHILSCCPVEFDRSIVARLVTNAFWFMRRENRLFNFELSGTWFAWCLELSVSLTQKQSENH